MRRNDYFEWLCDIVCGDLYSKRVSFRELLRYLFDTDFVYSIQRDKNRAEDGLSLRDKFGADYEGPCNILEMMVALSIKCENIMDDPQIGNRTGQWFWGMIVNLGLGSMIDERFDYEFVNDTITRFLDREYAPNGRGGLFTIEDCEDDLRDVEIWIQLCWYLDSIDNDIFGG